MILNIYYCPSNLCKNNIKYRAKSYNTNVTLASGVVVCRVADDRVSGYSAPGTPSASTGQSTANWGKVECFQRSLGLLASTDLESAVIPFRLGRPSGRLTTVPT